MRGPGLGMRLFLGGLGGGIVSSIKWWLTRVLNTQATIGADSTFARGGSVAWVPAFDATLGSILVTTGADGVASPYMRQSFDTEEGATPGPELITGDDFTFDTVGNWVGEDCTIATAGNELTATYTAPTQRVKVSKSTVIGSTYEVTARVRSDNATSNFQVGSQTDLSSGVALSPTFQSITHQFIATAGTTNITVFTVLGAGQTVVVDNGVTLKLITPVWLNTVSKADSTKLHPTKIDAETGATIFLQYDFWTAKSYSAGDKVYVAGSDNWNYSLESQGGASATMPVVVQADIGSTVSDGVVTWNVVEYYSGGATATENHLPGLLSEGVGVNLALRSEQLEITPWNSIGSVTVTPNTTTAPNGINTADTFHSTGVSALTQPADHVSGTMYTVSQWVKSKGLGNDVFRLMFDSGVGDSVSPDFTATNVWQRFYHTALAANTDSRNTGILRDSAANDVDVYAWGFDFKAGPLSSYIPTTNGSVQRNASSETSTQVISSRFVRFRVTSDFYSGEKLLSDGTNSCDWTGTDLTWTDGTTVLTAAAVSLALGDVVTLDTTDGKLYVRETLEDTNGAFNPVWSTISVMGNISDVAEGDTIDPLDSTWKDPT